ncbi:MAG: hypothetical protein AAFS13_00385 [Pseudomonadota bacterium]
MNQRLVPLAGILALGMSACATVTEFRGEDPVTISLTEEQSALRGAADQFSDVAAARGWVQRSGGIADLASYLIEGRSPELETESYANLIGMGVRPGDDVMRTLASDAVDAASRLSQVSDKADVILGDAARAVSRSDVIAFEQALVNAQKCRRSFAEIAGAMDVALPSMAEVALEAFDAELDRANGLADHMADAYTGSTGATIS